MRPSKPSFKNVVDLGLRDVGVESKGYSLGADLRKMLIRVIAPGILLLVAMAQLLGMTGAAWLIPLFGPVWLGAVVWLGVRSASKSPVIVVKIGSEGSDQVLWLLLAPAISLAVLGALATDPLLVAVAVPLGGMALLVRRARGRLPAVLDELRPHLAADETVLGDAFGLAQGARGWDRGFRLVVATDRRLLVTTSGRSSDQFLLVDAPYERVVRFGVEWKQRGYAGALSLTVDGETHVINSTAPANLVSVARALRSHGVQAGDPAAVEEAERAWDEARRRHVPGEPREPLLDRKAMNTREFNRGLWMLLRLSAAIFYLNAFGIGLGFTRNLDVAMLLVPFVCGVSGYIAGTRASLAYLVPLNLLVSPVFFFADAGTVIGLMLVLSALAAAGLYAGVGLRRALTRRGAAPEVKPVPVEPAPRGSVQYTLSARGVIRLMGMVLAGVLVLAVCASAAGFELHTLRMAVDELTGEQVPVDGRSNLTGNFASVTYTPGPDLHEFITDHPPEADPTDGVRWELRSSFTKGYNFVSLAHYVPDRRIDDAASLAAFLADKDDEHTSLAGFPVTHTKRVVDGRTGYVWNHGSRSGYWYYAAWFPQGAHTVRVECIAKKQRKRFGRLCAEAMRSLEIR